MNSEKLYSLWTFILFLMSSFVQRDSATNTINVSPKEGLHSATMILLHGLGDSAEGLADVAETINRFLPHLKIVVPTAPAIPVTLNGGAVMNAWHDIKSPSDGVCEGVESSADIVKQVLEKESALGIPYHRILLAGFSQGGALSLFVGLQLRLEEKLAGILCLSGYLPGADRLRVTPGLEGTKILHCHGTIDPMVPYNKAELTKTKLLEMGLTSYELKPMPGMPHTITQEVMEAAMTFINDILPHDETYTIQPKVPSEMTIKELKAAIRAAHIGAKAVGLSEKHELVKLLEDHRAAAATNTNTNTNTL